MKIWAINVGEPLPLDAGTWRPWRVGITTKILADRGHHITWWSSTMNHHSKQKRFGATTELPLFDNARLILLNGRHYQRNLSAQRILNHRQIAREFRRLAAEQDRPDVIFCALPTLELAREAVRFGKQHHVPVIIDIRDQWPDFMVELAPSFLGPLARLALQFMYRDLREACCGATGITGNAPALVSWGVKNAGRKATENDRYFPHGYPEISYPAPLMQDAENFWDDLGVTREDNIPNICFIGSVRYTVMDFETVLAGFKPISDRARLVIAGTGDDLKKLKTQAAGISNVIYAGWVDGPAVKTLMQRSSLGLAPYRNSDNFKDSVPNKLIEYMSEGLPIVSSLEGFSRQLLSEHQCGYFFSEDQPETLTATLRSALDDRLARQEMGAREKAIFEESYSAEELYGKLADYLENMAENYKEKPA